jgi:hypothetical protein
MEAEVSSPCSLKPAIGVYSKPVEFETTSNNNNRAFFFDQELGWSPKVFINH